MRDTQRGSFMYLLREFAQRVPVLLRRMSGHCQPGFNLWVVRREKDALFGFDRQYPITNRQMQTFCHVLGMVQLLSTILSNLNSFADKLSKRADIAAVAGGVQRCHIPVAPINPNDGPRIAA